MTAKGIAALAVLRLNELQVRSSQRLERGWCREIARMPALTVLWVNGSNLDDGLLAELTGSSTLTDIVAVGTAVTDAGLEQLRTATIIRYINVAKTKVTATGVKQLAAARPDMTIEWDGVAIKPTKKP